MIYIVDTLEIASTFEMASVACESRRSSAYSEDLRLRMVYQREGLGVSYAEIATNVNIDQWTVKRVVKLFNDTGSVTKKSRKITEVVQFFILQLVPQCPSWYHVERDQL